MEPPRNATALVLQFQYNWRKPPTVPIPAYPNVNAVNSQLHIAVFDAYVLWMAVLQSVILKLKDAAVR